MEASGFIWSEDILEGYRWMCGCEDPFLVHLYRDCMPPCEVDLERPGRVFDARCLLAFVGLALFGGFPFVPLFDFETTITFTPITRH